jgi:hypothetical protein
MENTNKPGIDRRSVLKAAAWSAPAVAVAVATPLAAASVGNAALAFTDSETGLLTLTLLDGGGVLTAQALTTVPTELTLTNGAGAIDGATATVTITVGRPGGINIPVGQARGFGVASYDGTASTAGERTATYQSAPIIGQYGFPITTFTRATTVTVASNGNLVLPVTFGLAGVSTGVAISALSSFPVTATVDFGGGNSYTATSTVSVPVGAGLL